MCNELKTGKEEKQKTEQQKTEKQKTEKQKKARKKLPMIGQRIVRSVLAVFLCFAVYFLRGRRGIPFYSALAVLQCMQPYRKGMKRVAVNRVTGTFIGAFWGLVVLIIENRFPQTFGTGQTSAYVLISLVTGVVLYSTVLLNCKDTSYFSCVVFLCITVAHMTDANPWLFVWNRVLDTLIGIALAVVVNSLHFPRKKQTDVLFVSGIDDTILSRNDKMSPYCKVELNRLIDEGAKFTVSTYRTPATVRESLPGIELKLPIIAMNGAVLYDMEENAYLLKTLMEHDQAKRVMDFLDRRGMPYFINTVVDNLLVIYYSSLSNEAMRRIFDEKRRSPYRNYVFTEKREYDHVVYLLLVDRSERIEKLYRELVSQAWANEYRFVRHDSDDYPGYTYIKIYDCHAVRKNMLEQLSRMLQIDQVVTFGSIPGRYDVYVEDAAKDTMVKTLKAMFEPITVFGHTLTAYDRRKDRG